MPLRLTDYAALHTLDLADAVRLAVDSGLTLGLYASDLADGTDAATEDDALLCAQEDPSLVYLTGADEQTGVTADDLEDLHTFGFAPPTVLDASTGWMVAYPTDRSGDTDCWGVSGSQEDGEVRWTLIHGEDGEVRDEFRPVASLRSALCRAYDLNDEITQLRGQ